MAQRKWPRWLCTSIAWLDYALLLPAVARLPPWAAAWPLRLRGTLNYLFDLEWRTLTLGHGYVREATLLAMRAIVAMTGSRRPAWWLTWRRFVCASWEEYDALRLSRMDWDSVHWSGSGLADIQRACAAGIGVVVLTGHFDSLYMGLMRLSRAGVRVNLMSSSIFDDPRVPRSIQRHFRRKSAAMSAQFAPGRVLNFENGAKHFVDALRRGEVLVIACDGPSVAAQRASVVTFLGGQQAMAAGPEFFARKGRSLVSMYTCWRESGDCFRMDFSPPLSFKEDGLQRAFDRLDAEIRAQPWRWWAADLYRAYAPPANRGAADR